MTSGIDVFYIGFQLPITMTVKQLKVKIFNEFEIPGNVQRWIIGKTLAENDDATLEDLNAIEGTPVFLYLVAPGNFSSTLRTFITIIFLFVINFNYSKQ